MKNFIKGLYVELLIQLQNLIDDLKNKVDIEDDKLNRFKKESIRQIESLHQEVNLYYKKPEMDIKEFGVYNLLNYNPFYEEFQNLEQYRYQPVVRYSKSDSILNSLIDKIYKEINIFHPSPFVTTISNIDQYYWAFPEYGIIALPLGEEKNILNLPDLYHEIAHFIYENHSELFFDIITSLVKEHFNEEIDRIYEENRDPALKDLFEEILDKWKQSWIEEFICDLIATFLVGSAYAWTNFKISVYSSGYDKIFKYTDEHPSDESRMRMICFLLKKVGDFDKVDSLRNVWSQFKKTVDNPIPDNYDKIFPDDLLLDITDEILVQLEAIGLNSYQTQLKQFSTPVTFYLNKSWEKVLNSPKDYKIWTNKVIEELGYWESKK